jgi:hypothetical protein
MTTFPVPVQTTSQIEEHRRRFEKQRQADQWQAVQDYARAHPGVSHRSAFAILQHDRPALFRDPDSGQTSEQAEEMRHSNQQKQDRIHAAIAELRAKTPMTFVRVWNQIRAAHPDWFEFDETPQRRQSPKTAGPSRTASFSDGRNAYRAEVLRAQAQVAAMRAEQKKWGTVVVQGGIFTDIWTGENVTGL